MQTPSAEMRRESPAEYHGGREAWGHTMCESVRRCLARIPLILDGCSPEVSPQTQEVFDVGNALHTRVLEPAEFSARYQRAPIGDKRKKEWHAAEKLLPPGAALLRPKTFDALEVQGENIRSHPIVGPAIDHPDAIREASIYWRDPASGLLLKCRPDLMVPPGPERPGFVLDLKTTRDSVHPEDVARAFVNHGYHRQQAHYSKGFAALFGQAPETFVFVVVSKVAPYEVAAYVLDDGSAELGEEQRERDLARIAGAIEHGNYAETWNAQISTLVLPAYAHFED